MKKIILLFFMFFVLFSCQSNTSNYETGKIKVEASIVPFASIANYIGGEFVEANSIIPAGVSPHGFDLKPQDMIAIENSNLIIYLGLEHIDGFLDKVITNKNTLKVSDGISLLYGFEDDDEEEKGLSDDDKQMIADDSGEMNVLLEGYEIEADPHIWTSPTNAKIIAEKIRDKLSELLPEQKNYFQNNLENLKNELDTTLDYFTTKTKGKDEDFFIIFHDAYNYLFEELGISNDKKLIFKKSVLSDASIEEMKNLTDEIQEKNIKIIFKEPQFDDSNLKKFATEYNLNIFDLDPLGTDSGKNGYIENLKKNLENLEKIYE